MARANDLRRLAREGIKYVARQNRSPLKRLTSNLFEWLSTYGTDFNLDFDVTPDAGETFGLSVFRHDGDTVFAGTSRMGVASRCSGEPGFPGLYSARPTGAEWEHSPAGWLQTPPHEWLRRHDEYTEGD